VIGGTSTGVVVVWETLAKPAGMEGRPDTELVHPPPRCRAKRGQLKEEATT